MDRMKKNILLKNYFFLNKIYLQENIQFTNECATHSFIYNLISQFSRDDYFGKLDITNIKYILGIWYSSIFFRI